MVAHMSCTYALTLAAILSYMYKLFSNNSNVHVHHFFLQCLLSYAIVCCVSLNARAKMKCLFNEGKYLEAVLFIEQKKQVKRGDKKKTNIEDNTNRARLKRVRQHNNLHIRLTLVSCSIRLVVPSTQTRAHIHERASERDSERKRVRENKKKKYK